MTSNIRHSFSTNLSCIGMETYFGYIKCTQDALLIFKACQIGALSRVRRRLSDRERANVRSGSIFVWYESEAGMRRWTDGRSWSPSRVSGSFLTYKELNCKQNKRFIQPAQVVFKENGLVKQSFSIMTQPSEKIHIISYYTEADLADGKLLCPTEDARLMKSVNTSIPGQYQTKHTSNQTKISGSAVSTSFRSFQPWYSPVPANIPRYNGEDDNGSYSASITTSPSLINSPDCNSVSTASLEEPQDLPSALIASHITKSDMKCERDNFPTAVRIQLPPIDSLKGGFISNDGDIFSLETAWKCSEDVRQLKALSQQLRL